MKSLTLMEHLLTLKLTSVFALNLRGTGLALTLTHLQSKHSLNSAVPIVTQQIQRQHLLPRMNQREPNDPVTERLDPHANVC